MPLSPRSLLGSYDVAAFLRDHWQRAPLFLPGAVRGFESPISADELAGLACEEDVESRLVTHTEAEPWRLRHGPFEETDFSKLDASAWTLLVQDVDKHVPDVAALLDWVRFLPSWCVDDIMISVAGDGGSVGPHVDQYDVFLVQAAGTREWRLDRGCDPADLLPDVDLRILRSFSPSEVLVAKPGDVLYLPAKVGHWGVARGEAMTYSFGFRTPSMAELFQRLAETLETERAGNRLPIRAFEAGCQRSEVPRDLVEQVRRALTHELGTGNAGFSELGAWLAKTLSTGKPTLEVDAPEVELTGEQVAARLAQGDELLKEPKCRWLFTESPSGEFSLCVHGDSFPLGSVTSPRAVAAALCDTPVWNAEWLNARSTEYSLFELLAALHARGYVKFASDE